MNIFRFAMYLFEENNIDFSGLHLSVLKEELNAILLTSGACALLLNKDLEVQYYSDEMVELYDIKQEDIGKKISEISGYFSECDVSFYAEKIFENNVDYRGKITTTKGKHYMKRMRPFKKNDDTIIGVIVAFTDITDLEDAQIALEESEQRFRDMAELAVDYIFEIDKQGIVTYVSPSVQVVLGYEPADVLGSHLSSFIPKDESRLVIKEVIRNTQMQTDYPPLTHHILRKDGTIIIVESRGRVIKDNEGKVIGYRGLNRNITEKISAEREKSYLNQLLERKVAQRTAELEENQKQLVEAQRIGKLGSWIWNLQTHYKVWSDMMFEIFDVDKTPDVAYEAFNERIHEDDRDFMNDVERKAMESGDSHYVVQSRIRRRDNEVRYIEATAHIYRDETGKAIKLIGTAQDITEIKRQEAERRKLISDLMQQNKDLQQFSYIISHNLRAPVANIVGLGKMYRSGKADERNEQVVKNMQESAEDIDGVIRDLSNILTLRSGIGAEKESVNIQDIFSTVIKTLHPQIEEVTAKITSDLVNAPKIFTIKSYLHSILYNLISNALKYRSPERALEINVAAGKRINYAWISVQDNGLGIDTDKNRDKLFGLYRRFHPQIEGKGIGLYLVKVQAETLGGWAEVESELGKGTRFTVFLSINSLTQNEA